MRKLPIQKNGIVNVVVCLKSKTDGELIAYLESKTRLFYLSGWFRALARREMEKEKITNV